ncbi:MAG: F0F1 ATP synthase subunit delta, partial [Oscillospiraceae bacterium]|nr:F0F1 ATP synthase subunit delta [Oscillospiraceae bacterium]
DVTTAVPLKADAAEKLRIKLEKLYGKKIVINEHTDPQVLGGVRVVCEGKMLDGTLKTRLEGLRETITDNIDIGR